MKKYLVLFYSILFYSIDANSQGNLVPNGNFEIYSPCPTFLAQIANASGWTNATPTLTPDYFNSCATYSTYASVPANGYGYQQEDSGGGGYAGIYVFNRGQKNNGREYIQIKLNDTLQTGRKYLASMQVSRNHYDYAISTMGMYFTATSFTSSIGFISASPQVKNASPLVDTLNWMLVQDTVIGTGIELFLTIGNFSYDSLSDTLRMVNPLFDPYSYYYIDNVSVIDVAEIGVNEVQQKHFNFSIYPNPTNNKLMISIPPKERKALIEIYGFDGRLVVKKEILAENNIIETTLDLENGVYMINLKTESFSEVQKLIITK